MTIKAFILRMAITMDAERVATRPDTTVNGWAGGGDWARTASHYRCVLRCGRRRMTVYYSMGAAHTKGPDAAGVLDSLLLDSSADGQTFEEWCSDLGYDTDSRNAERVYKLCVGAATKLRAFLGSQAAWDTLRDCERL